MSSTLFRVIPHDSVYYSMLFPVAPCHASHAIPCYSLVPCYSKLFHVIPHCSRLFHMISSYSLLFHCIASGSTLFHAIWLHVIPCFQAIPCYSTLFHVIWGHSTLFLIIPRNSTLFHVIPSFQTVGSRWLVVFVRHSLGVCVGFQAFKLQQGQFGAITPVCAFLLYSTLSSFHVVPDDSILFHVILCCSSLHVAP